MFCQNVASSFPENFRALTSFVFGERTVIDLSGLIMVLFIYLDFVPLKYQHHFGQVLLST